MKSCAIFDFADTLAELVPDRFTIVANYIQHSCGINIDRQTIHRAYKTLESFMPYSSVKIQNKKQHDDFYYEFNRKLFLLLGVEHCLEPEGLVKVFLENKAHWQLKRGAKELLDELRRSSYRIAIVSNFDTRLEHLVFNHLNLTEIVDYLYISQKEGLEKPDLYFYKRFIERYEIPLKSSFYIGDNYLLDFIPANSLGLRTWLLDEVGLYPHLPQSIRSLDQFIDHLP
jgi:HAD superfamily hydrolase (TIGR01549 family)